jgi:hypothetical protein
LRAHYRPAEEKKTLANNAKLAKGKIKNGEPSASKPIGRQALSAGKLAKREQAREDLARTSNSHPNSTTLFDPWRSWRV